MATKNRNNILKDVRFGVSQLTHALIADGTFDFNQGDLLYYDSAAKIVKPLDSDAHAATLVGVAARAAYLAPYVGMNIAAGPAMQKNYYDSALVAFGVVASFYSTTAETYYDNDQVFWGSDAQTLTKVDPGVGHPVGVVKMPSGSAALTIAGGATVLIPVLVIPQFPIASL